MKHNQVIQSWLEGTPAKGNSMSTDGKHLYSYSLIIGQYTYSDDVPIIYNYTTEGGAFRSYTTTKQVKQTVNLCQELEREYVLKNLSQREVPYD